MLHSLPLHRLCASPTTQTLPALHLLLQQTKCSPQIHGTRRRQAPPTSQLQLISAFHSTPHRGFANHSNSTQNHYATLESTPHATPAQLKKQFYTLSKKYHPDLHPGDADASARFVRISTAWGVLGNSSSRAAYDRELGLQNGTMSFGGGGGGGAAAGTRGGPTPSGSYSSAQAAYGARPASGLSKRRGPFRGPPPSFYRSGAWGAYEGKRRAAAEGAERAARDGAANGGGGGFAPGQGQGHADFEVPHFDRDGHYRRQEGVEEGLKKRRTIMAEREAMRREAEQSSGLAGFMIVSSALLFTALLGAAWDKSTRKRARDSH